MKVDPCTGHELMQICLAKLSVSNIQLESGRETSYPVFY